MHYEQLTIDAPDAVTEFTIRVGLVGAIHGQWQLEASDSQGTLLAMVSRQHFDQLHLEAELRRAFDELAQVARRRHGPF